ncbi:unnamed protein product [Prorocentrum cordatum]|uniref:Uncharacterized protein n=1 Tax=Prorocentrum cordatum TaxID=2364126 RepID=A0ABN9SI73_9DINO|nr:unnamed protein product [Polarella glacialis]
MCGYVLPSAERYRVLGRGQSSWRGTVADHYSVEQTDAEIPEWVALGKVELKVVRGCTDSGLRYLNLYVKHLGRAGFVVGGLLGEDDHADVMVPPEACATRLALVDNVEAGLKAPSVASVAVATLA